MLPVEAMEQFEVAPPLDIAGGMENDVQ
jgi:hypothetical protein